MTSEFLVTTTSRFDRELIKLAAQHPGLPKLYRGVIEILERPIHITGAVGIPSKSFGPSQPGKGSTASARAAFDFAMTLEVRQST